MRVLHVISGVARRYGGPSYAVAGICHALRSDGIDAEIATTDADGAHGKVNTADIQRMFADVPVRIFHRDIGESLKYSKGLGKWLRVHVRDYDVVHIHAIFSHASIAASRHSVRANVPFIVRPLGSFDPWSMSKHGLRKRIFLRVFCGALLNRAAFFHYTTPEEQKLASEIVRRPSFVTPLGVDEALFATTARSRDVKYVLALGRLHPKKNVDMLIRAFATSDSSWRLRIAGEGDVEYTGHLKDVAYKLGIGDRVEFLGWVDGEAKWELLRGASLFALASSQENFGISAAEAMAAGVPVLVATAVNLASDVIAGEAGWAVNIEQFDDALRTALSDERELDRRGRAARKLAFDKYRWSSTARILGEVYGQLLRTKAVA